MRTSETTKAISDAISKAQGSMPNVQKLGKSNYGHFATLDDGLELCRQHCSKHNIAITQATRMSGEIMVLDTRLSCGNEWIEAEYPVIRFPARQQEIGSALTYSRRYSLFALIGIAGEEDDDGTAANANAVAAPARITEKQVKELENLLIETGSDPVKFQQYFKIKALSDLSSADFARAVASLEKKKVAA